MDKKPKTCNVNGSLITWSEEFQEWECMDPCEDDDPPCHQAI